MAEFALLSQTAVTVGSSIPFTTTIVKGCPCIRHRNGSANIRVKGGSCCKPNRYNIQFHGNVTGVTGQITLGIYLDGELIPESIMNVVAAAPANVLSVDSSTEIEVDGCMQNISVRNIAGTGLLVNTANIIVRREVA